MNEQLAFGTRPGRGARTGAFSATPDLVIPDRENLRGIRHRALLISRQLFERTQRLTRVKVSATRARYASATVVNGGLTQRGRT